MIIRNPMKQLLGENTGSSAFKYNNLRRPHSRPAKTGRVSGYEALPKIKADEMAAADFFGHETGNRVTAGPFQNAKEDIEFSIDPRIL